MTSHTELSNLPNKKDPHTGAGPLLQQPERELAAQQLLHHEHPESALPQVPKETTKNEK